MAIAIPTLVNGLDKGRQKRTMADIRLIGGSIEAYAVDNSAYPVGTSISALLDLTPEYMDDLIGVDAWDHDLVYTATATFYTLGSTGKNGGNTLTLVAGGGPSRDFDDDIIFRMGNFVQWPEGSQE
jgi:type II secretory pathway pseudopilin PulG